MLESELITFMCCSVLEIKLRSIKSLSLRRSERIPFHSHFILFLSYSMSACRVPSLLPRYRSCRGRQVLVRHGWIELLQSDHSHLNFLISLSSTFLVQAGCSAAFYTPDPAGGAVVDDRSCSILVRLECGKAFVTVTQAVRLCGLRFVLCR
jgi:hypothetical protein